MSSRHEWKHRLWLFALLLPVTMAASCPNGGTIDRQPPEPPLPLHHVISRVNANNARMDFLLKAGGLSAVVECEDDRGQATYHLRGLMIFRRPRSLYMELDYTGQTVYEIGSNDEEFWAWEKKPVIRDAEPTYWWGTYAGAPDFGDDRLPVRPDVMVELLGVGELPEDLSSKQAPLMKVDPGSYELSFLREDEHGRRRFYKSIEISRYPPYLISRITYFDLDGSPVVQAALSDYQLIEDSDVLAPHRIDVQSLTWRMDVALKFRKMERFDAGPAVDAFFVSPRAKNQSGLGRMRRLDRVKRQRGQFEDESGSDGSTSDEMDSGDADQSAMKASE